MTVAESLKFERNKLNMSQKEFAEFLGINLRTYASYERGERDISTAVILSICQTLNISSDVLLGNTPQAEDVTSASLTDNELEMIEVFKELTPTQQGKLIERAKIMSEDNGTNNIKK